jgi:capsular exopolysaccharide synthesis family protein
VKKEHGRTVEIADYLKVLRRRWRLVIVTAAVVGAAALGLSLAQTKEYASSAQLFVSTSDLDQAAIYQGGQFSQARVQSYAQLVNGIDLAGTVIDDLHLDVTPAQLSRQVRAEVALNTVNLTLTATDADPRRAQQIAQGYAEAMVDLVSELETPPGQTQAPIKATIVDRATYPRAAASPRVERNVGLGLVLGLLLGLGLAILRSVLDTRINGQDDLAEVADAPVLGSVAFDAEMGRTPLISSAPSHSSRAEAFRVLRTNLQFIDVDKPQKVFVVTSAVPGEGKTSTAVNVAISLAQAGVRTLLLEADMRRPRSAQLLGLDSAIGLTSVLVGSLTAEEATQRHEASGLDYLASGAIPPNPAELLQSRAMVDLLSELRSQHDVIIIDAPPLLPVTDATLLAAKADGAVLVIRHGRTTRDQLAHSLERLRQVDGHVAGVVLNMVPDKGRRYGYGYGYGYAPTGTTGSSEPAPAARTRS